MNKDILKGNWKELKGKVKQEWGKITDDEITQINGSCEELEGTLQKKYGYEKEQARKEIEKFMSKWEWKEKSTE